MSLVSADYSLIPTPEQADFVYWLEMEYRNTIQQTIAQARYYQEYQDNCELEEAFFTFDRKKITCEEIEDHFRSKYFEIANLAYKLDGYCDEYFGRSGKACSMYVDMYRS